MSSHWTESLTPPITDFGAIIALPHISYSIFNNLPMSTLWHLLFVSHSMHEAIIEYARPNDSLCAPTWKVWINSYIIDNVSKDTMQLCRRRISKIWIHSTSQTERDESKIFSTDVPELWTIIGQTFANLTNIIFNECTVLLFLALHGSFSSVTYVDCQAEEQQKTDQVIAMLDQMNINLGPGGRSLVDRFLIGSPQVVHFKQVVNPPLNFVYDPDYSRNTIENTENYRKFREM